ncbi:hypothetical protein M3Y97_00168700 [Aphelenchoides bicaudatus]|nr:hypothetical protein M3Y97_00168700 [Aphelenchoides bicaudatus]
MIHRVAVLLCCFLFLAEVRCDDQLDTQLVEWLKDGGYLLNPEEATVEIVQNELERLKPALEKAVGALKNDTQQEDKDNSVKQSPTVFQVGFVVKDKKITRRIDFIQWARTIGMRALALGKRYVGVSFQLDGQRNRLYMFFVEEKEAADLPKGRSGLDTNTRELFERLKEITKD